MKPHAVASEGEIPRIRSGRLWWIGGHFLKSQDFAVIVFSSDGVGDGNDRNGAGDHDGDCASRILHGQIPKLCKSQSPMRARNFCLLSMVLVFCDASGAEPQLKTETFDRDPHWDA